MCTDNAKIANLKVPLRRGNNSALAEFRGMAERASGYE